MEMNLRFPNPAVSDAEALFAMKANGKLVEDLEAQRQGMVDFLDTLNYMNGNSFDDPLMTRHAITYVGLALPSLAFINPHKTREMIYNLGLCCININCKHLLCQVYPYNSNNMKLIERGMLCGLYRLVSGRDEYDKEFHEVAEEIYDIIIKNSFSQNVYGIDSTRGGFEVMPNVMAMMALEMHDRFFGSRLSHVNANVLAFIKEKMMDEKTGLFASVYHTGSVGYAGEFVNPKSAWKNDKLKPAANGLAIAFLNYYDPEHCKKAWEAYKELFLDDLLALSTEDIADMCGMSFDTQLGAGSEDYLAAMLAAKEMNDLEAFKLLQDHLYEISEPHMWEGHLFLTQFGDLEHMIGHFLFFARAHAGWKNLFEHDWENFYEMDYNEIR